MTNHYSLKELLIVKRERTMPRVSGLLRLKVRAQAENNIYAPIQRQLNNEFVPTFYGQAYEDIDDIDLA